MGLRIRTNRPSLVAQRHLAINNNNVAESSQRLSSGKRINSAKDDPAGLAMAETMNSSIRSINAAKQNANDAVSLVQTAEGNMSELSNMVVRMRELTMQAASDTVGDFERSLLNKEYVQLAEEIDRINSSAEFKGFKFFSAERPSDSLDIQVGIHQDNGDMSEVINLNLEGLDFSTDNLGIGKGEEIGGFDAESSVSREEITEKLAVLDGAINQINTERATLGSLQSRLHTSIQNHMVQIENMSEAKSRILDTDYAEESARNVAARILSQASASSLAHANQWPETALALLR